MTMSQREEMADRGYHMESMAEGTGWVKQGHITRFIESSSYGYIIRVFAAGISCPPVETREVYSYTLSPIVDIAEVMAERLIERLEADREDEEEER